MRIWAERSSAMVGAEYFDALDKFNEIRNRYSHRRKYALEQSGLDSWRGKVDVIASADPMTLPCEKFELAIEGSDSTGQRKKIVYTWTTADTKKSNAKPRHSTKELMDWFPAITTTGLFAAALWFGQNLIRTRLTNSVAHEFNAKLEALRTQLREGEERFKADLRAKEAEITAPRSGAMTALASRQIAVDERRLEAVDQLWSSVNALAPARMISTMMSSIKFESAAQIAERDPKVRQLFETFGTGFDMKNLDLSGAAKARPFVSPMAWATYSALLAVVMHAVMRWHVIKGGLGAKDFTDYDAINKLVKAALPHLVGYIDQHGPEIYHLLIEQLEAKLLQDLNDMLAGTDADKANIQQAAEILKQSNVLLKQANPGQYTA